MSKNNSKILLKKIELDRDESKVSSIRQECTLSHDNGKTTLQQDVVFTKKPEGWVAELHLKKFPEQQTMNEAADRLGDWLIRLGETLKENNPENIELNNIDVSY